MKFIAIFVFKIFINLYKCLNSLDCYWLTALALDVSDEFVFGRSDKFSNTTLISPIKEHKTCYTLRKPAKKIQHMVKSEIAQNSCLNLISLFHKLPYLICDILRNHAFLLLYSLHVLGILPPELRSQRHNDRRYPHHAYHSRYTAAGPWMYVVHLGNRPIPVQKKIQAINMVHNVIVIIKLGLCNVGTVHYACKQNF